MEASKSNSVIKALVLSSWDHVLGPTTTYLWRSQLAGEFWTPKPSGKNCSDFTTSDNYISGSHSRNVCDKTHSGSGESIASSGNNSKECENTNYMDLNGSNTLKSEDLLETISYLVGQMLHGHLIAPYPARTVCTKEVFVCDKEVFLYAVVFQQKYSGRFKTAENECVPYCLALIFSYSDWSFYHNVRQFIDQYMKKMVATLADGLEKFGGIENSASAIGSAVVLVKDLDEKLCSLKDCAAERQQNIPFNLTYFSAQHKCNKRFLERAVLSHLHTCGCSVVTGESVDEINVMVQTLSIFLEPGERVSVSFASSKEMWPYLPGLYIQGLLKDSHGKSNISVDEVLQNSYPTTLIDVSHEKVRQSPFPVPPQGQLLPQTKSSSSKHSDKSAWTTDSAFRTINETGKLVPNFLQEISLLLSDDSRGRYAEYFFSYLKTKAGVLISLLDKQSVDAKKPVQNAIMSGIGVTEVIDLHVILGVAEKIHPGTRSKFIKLTS